jgi:tetratricopeptide (TPR) repeat protein
MPPHLLGEILNHLHNRRYAAMLPLAEQAIRIDPTDANFYFYKGTALSGLQRHSEALSTFEQAILLDPKEALYQVNRGRALKDLKRYGEALMAYDQALRIDSQMGTYDNSAAWEGKSEVLELLGRKQEAKEAYQKFRQSQKLRWEQKS